MGCRGRSAQSELLRLVRVGDDVIDGTAPRLPGRGGYLHRDPACWKVAEQRRAVQRFFGPGALWTAQPPSDWDETAATR
ncbi:YlxR family protein [Tessaracoccus antarcticus]|uniref:YlxR family protein n=1 Tax=Tessaracoccus antarcticus TaxID=2479848 RepID=A0A3M0GFA3_9ACTN|nr:YlxR family protein [Tessaracoccus antarcticus]